MPAKCCCLARQVFLAENAGSGDAVDEFKAHLPAVEAVELAVDVIKKFFDVLYGRSWSASRASTGSSFLVLFFWYMREKIILVVIVVKIFCDIFAGSVWLRF